MTWSVGVWLAVGAAAIAFTGGSIVLRHTRIVELEIFARLPVMAVAVLLWIVWSINAFHLVSYSQGLAQDHNYGSLGYIGGITAFVLGIDLIMSTISLLENYGVIDTNLLSERGDRGV